MKDKPDNVTFLTNFQLKRIRVILGAWEDLDETVAEAINKAQVICSKIWYAVDNIMDELSIRTMMLIEKACPPGMMIEQVEKLRDEGEDKIKKLDHVSIHDVDHLIRQPFAVEKKINIYIQFWHKMDKNDIEDHKCNARLGIEFASYPDIEELLRIWKMWRDFLGY